MQAIDSVMTTVSFSDAGIGSPLFHDYLRKKFHITAPDSNSLLARAKTRHVAPAMRSHLVKTLGAHYAGYGITSGLSVEHINSLSEEHVFTVTTGHQPCLGSGPAYFIYKIVSVIALCRELNEQQQECRFVPVYWMNGEDHDFAEINHLWFLGKKFEWNLSPEPETATGRLSTEAIPEVLASIREIFSNLGKTGDEWARIENIYRESETLAEATFRLVHHWFGEYGLVILDQDQPGLKDHILPFLEKELQEETSYRALSVANEKLQLAGYDLQIQPREINLFYHAPEGRKRIVKDGDLYRIYDTTLAFTWEALREELYHHPRNFSTNVVTRPVFQELVLPNIAYVGGPAEVHYWLQLPAVFEAFDVPFPAVIMRDSFLLMPQKWKQKMEKTGFVYSDYFQPLHELEKLYVSRQQGGDEQAITAAVAGIEQIYDELETVLGMVDGSLRPATQAEKQKAFNGLKNLESKFIKSLKNREENSLKTIRDVRERIFPGGTFQERREHILNFTSDPGEMIRFLLQYADPLNPVVKILEID